MSHIDNTIETNKIAAILLVPIVFILTLFLTGCGDAGYNTGVLNTDGAYMKNESFDMDEGFFVNSPSMGGYLSDASYEEEPATKQSAEFSKEMLVYRGSVTISTKEYDKSLSLLRELLGRYDCFVEDSSEYMYGAYDDEEGLRTYRATVRVSSKEYDSFLAGTEGLGKVTGRESAVDNMTASYSDTTTALRIQSARLDRYLTMLENETDNYTAMQIEDKITEIQIAVAQLEARKKLIETDVAYSYVDICMKEVKMYEAQFSYDDPLYKRVWSEIVNTTYGFVAFLEELLLFCIRIFPYAVLVFFVVFVYRKTSFHKKRVEKRKEKKARKEQFVPSYPVSVPPTPPAPEKKTVEETDPVLKK